MISISRMIDFCLRRPPYRLDYSVFDFPMVDLEDSITVLRSTHQSIKTKCHNAEAVAHFSQAKGVPFLGCPVCHLPATQQNSIIGGPLL